ncbi:hypothetical protein [Roseospira goensis]|uniref:Uncharacterized protein n=1 Tax=Roseospira goensis TaxID=391922 RepID=A0A7W6RX47_9PROT|nr:hypothetical protein [Roseospira goensis]MBB4284838.1 hypothetical protein [Roseospira goensis]
MWLLLVRAYVAAGPGWANLLDSHPTDFALFLASATAPLAAVWLVAAFILNGVALARTQDAVRAMQRQALRTSGEIEALVRTSIEMQEQARRQSFLNGAELALKDLNSQAGMITGRLGVLSADETEYLWALNAAGDPWAFCHALLERSELEDDFIELVAHRVAGDEVASAGLQRFLRRYERLLALAKEYDADKLVREVLEDGPLDRLHALFQAVSARVQALVGPPPPTSGPYPEPSGFPDDFDDRAGDQNAYLDADDPSAAPWPDRPAPPAYGLEGARMTAVPPHQDTRRGGVGLADVLGPAAGMLRLFADIRARLLPADHGPMARHDPRLTEPAVAFAGYGHGTTDAPDDAPLPGPGAESPRRAPDT